MRPRDGFSFYPGTPTCYPQCLRGAALRKYFNFGAINSAVFALTRAKNVPFTRTAKKQIAIAHPCFLRKTQLFFVIFAIFCGFLRAGATFGALYKKKRQYCAAPGAC